MAVFLFVMAAVTLLLGLVGLLAGHKPRTTGHQQAPTQLLRHAHGADGSMNRRGHAR
jgi:hypothetical protein